MKKTALVLGVLLLLLPMMAAAESILASDAFGINSLEFLGAVQFPKAVDPSDQARAKTFNCLVSCGPANGDVRGQHWIADGQEHRGEQQDGKAEFLKHDFPRWLALAGQGQQV